MASAPQQVMPTASPITPHLAVRGAKAAIAFYHRAFGAERLYLAEAPDGRVMHATLAVNGATLFLCDDFAGVEEGEKGQQAGSRPMVTIHLQVADADAAFARAVKAGAEVMVPLADQPWGDRYGKLKDPFGHHWSVGATIHQVSEDDMRRAADAFAGGEDEG